MKRKIPAMVLVTVLALMLLPSVARAATNWLVGTEDEFKQAVAAWGDGDTIGLTDDITLEEDTIDPAVSLVSKSITIDVGSHTLSIVNTGGAALQVGEGGVVSLEKTTGAFNVTGATCGVEAVDGGQATVTNATATDQSSCGAYAIGTGSTVTVVGDVQGGTSGALAIYGGSVTVAGHARAWSVYGAGANATGTGSTVTVSGDAEGTFAGACVLEGGCVTVAGHATATGADGRGVSAASTGSVITVLGDVQSGHVGAYARNDSTITVEGAITAAVYISIDKIDKTKLEGAAGSGDDAGYQVYTDMDSSGSKVRVKIQEDLPVCEIVSTSEKYSSLSEALAVVEDGDTIRLLTGLYHTGGISISGKSITFDVDSHALSIVNTGGVALQVDEGGVVSLEKTTGALMVTGTTCGVEAMAGSKAAVTKATATSEGGKGVYAWGGSSIEADSATATGPSSYGAYTDGVDSRAEVNGNAQGTLYGAYASGGGSVKVKGMAQGGSAGARAVEGGSIEAGSAMATDPGSHGASAYLSGSTVTVVGDAQGVTCGAYAFGTGCSVIVGGNVLAGNVGASGYGRSCLIMVGGNATATSGARLGMGVCAAEGSTIIVGGHVQGVNMGIYADGGGSATAYSAGATGESGTGAWAGYGSTITITGTGVTATGSDSCGVRANFENSRVEVNGSAQGTLYGACALYGGQITVKGDLLATSAGSVGAAAGGTGSLVTVEGAIMAADTYIAIGEEGEQVEKKPYPADGSLGVGANLGFLVYDDARHDGMVRVKVRVTGLPADWTMLTGGQVTWNPKPDGGSWHWDRDFFSASFNSPATFTAKKSGLSTISYTASGVTQAISVTIKESAVPATGQNVTPGIFLLLLAACLGGAAIVTGTGHRRKADD